MSGRYVSLARHVLAGALSGALSALVERALLTPDERATLAKLRVRSQPAARPAVVTAGPVLRAPNTLVPEDDT